MYLPTSTSYNANRVVPDAGDYSATITDVQDIGKQNTKFGPKEQLRLIFTLDGSGGITVTKKVTKTGNMAGNLYAIAAELRALPPGGGVDTDLLRGKRCIVTINRFQDQNGGAYAAVKKVVASDVQPPQSRQTSSPYSQPRYQYQQPYPAPPPQSNQITQANPISDDDVPF